MTHLDRTRWLSMLGLLCAAFSAWTSDFQGQGRFTLNGQLQARDSCDWQDQGEGTLKMHIAGSQVVLELQGVFSSRPKTGRSDPQGICQQTGPWDYNPVYAATWSSAGFHGSVQRGSRGEIEGRMEQDGRFTGTITERWQQDTASGSRMIQFLGQGQWAGIPAISEPKPLASAVPGTANLGIRVLNLEHRDQAELAPLIKPLLLERESLSGSQGQLALQASAERLDLLEALVRAFDRRRAELLITLKVAEPGMNIYSTQVGGQVSQRARVMEGAQAIFPAMGTPQSTRNPRNNPVRAAVTPGYWLLTPRLQGDKLILRWQTASVLPNPVLTSQAPSPWSRELTGRLGQWLSLNGETVDDLRQSMSVGDDYKVYGDTREPALNVLVRVDAL